MGMLNPQRNIAVVHKVDRFSLGIQYLLENFSRLYGHFYRLVPADSPEPNAELTIYYGVPPTGKAEKSLYIPRSDFFGPGFGTAVFPPPGTAELAAAAKGTALKAVLEKTAHGFSLRHDLFAAAFYVITGYHDWASKKRDQYGRVLASHIQLPAETWDLPVVNHWLRQLNELVGILFSDTLSAEPPRPTIPEQQTICMTHDIDLLRKYRRAALPRQLLRASRTKTASTELSRAREVLKGHAKDPYDCIDLFYTVKERVSAPSTFFFLGGPPDSKNGDYRINDRDVKNILLKAKNFGDEIALHGSWASPGSAAMLKTEKAAVEKAAGLPVLGSRQHYLRFDTPGTWKHLAEAGIKYDSTGGFPDRCGFKYGWSGCLRPFDLDTMQVLPMVEIPLICMDVTMANYEKIPAELALERLTNLLDAACDNVPGGAFVFLWHNTMGDRETFPGYWDTFEYFFSVASGAARFITLSQLCDEHAKRYAGYDE